MVSLVSVQSPSSKAETAGWNGQWSKTAHTMAARKQIETGEAGDKNTPFQVTPTSNQAHLVTAHFTMNSSMN